MDNQGISTSMPLAHEMEPQKLQISVAVHPWEKKGIYRFRYEVYVEEMAKPLGHITHKTKQIHDSLDEQSILLYAQSGTEIIATLRVSICEPEKFSPELAEIFHMHKFRILSRQASAKLALCTKLAVKAEYRSTSVLYLLLAETYKILRDLQIQFCFGGCNPYLVSLYEQIGFRRFANNFIDPGYGLLVPLVLVLEDIDHLKAVRSPLYRIARKRENNLMIGRSFVHMFPKTLLTLNTQLVSRNSLWEYVKQKIGNAPLELIPILSNVDEEAAKDFLHAGTVFFCAEGDCILDYDAVGSELYILLSGVLSCRTQAWSGMLKPGQHFGRRNLPNLISEPARIVACTASEVLVLSRQAIEKYQHRHPEAGNDIWQTIKSRMGEK